MRTPSNAALPNPVPRPPEELDALRRIWAIPRGWRLLTEYNNTVIGGFYVATAFLFFVLAGVLALVMRVQLAVPENALVGPTLYNQLFTMHGTVMMFLFAVPVVEAMGILLCGTCSAHATCRFRACPCTRTGRTRSAGLRSSAASSSGLRRPAAGS
jgi:cytochrome c oxidase subunit I+III